jgi:hypothetical protein
MQYLKSEYEAGLRVHTHIPLKKLYKLGRVLNALLIPTQQFYCTEYACRIAKALKNKSIDDNAKLVLRVLSSAKSKGDCMSRQKLFEETPLGLGSFIECMTELRKATCIAKKSNRYMAVKDYRIGRRNVIELFLKNFIDNFGFVNASMISDYLHSEISIAEIRDVLHILSKKGILVKGFFIKDDTNIYYLPACDVKYISEDLIPQFDTTFILTPEDRVVIYLWKWFAELLGKGSKYIVFKGSKPIGAFRGFIQAYSFIVKEPINTDIEFNALQQFCKKWYLKIRFRT